MEIFAQFWQQVIIIEQEHKPMPIWLMLVIATIVVGVIVTLIVNRVPDTVLGPVFKTILLWGSVIGLIIAWLWLVLVPLFSGVHVTR